MAVPRRAAQRDGSHAVRVLQVGLGGWGRDWAWRVFPEVAEVDLVGYVDSDPDALELVRERIQMPAGRCYASLETGLEATQPDAVLVTTHLPGHAPIIRAALEAGRHVLVEKPFAPSVAVAQELVRLATSRGLVLMVSQNYRFFPAVRRVARLVKEASLGALHQVSVEFRRWSPLRPDVPPTHHAYEQPLLVDMSIHHFDLMRLILGREPQRVSCEAWNPAWSGFDGPCAAVATIVFDGGLVVSDRASWISAGPSTPYAGEWRMDFEGGEVLWTSRGEDSSDADRVVLRPRGGKPKTLVLPRLRRIDRWASLAEFASAVRSGREPESSGRENLGSIALMTAAVESATRREPVWVSLD